MAKFVIKHGYKAYNMLATYGGCPQITAGLRPVGKAGRKVPNRPAYGQLKSLQYNMHYCLVSLMWMKIGSNDITAHVPRVS
jgi:hypothetical protein